MKSKLTTILLIVVTAVLGQTKDEPKTLESYFNTIDVFSGERVYYSDLNKSVKLSRYKGKETSTQYISVAITGNTLNYGCYGVTVVLENGRQIERSREKVKTSYCKDWCYDAFFALTDYEVRLLRASRIVAVRLYIYTAYVSMEDANGIKEAANIMFTEDSDNNLKIN